MNLLNNAAIAVSQYLSANNDRDFDPDSVTPGVIGFIATFVVVVVVVLLATDMVRRVRRTQYRAEVNDRLDAEAAALGDDASDGPDQTAGGSVAPGDEPRS
jgi:hypothetical protein